MRPLLTPRRTGWAILLIAFALRVWDFGNPVIHVDEQYYLLVGDRMLHGAIPYLDIWDRKPIGLFLLYAAIRLLPGDGILAYQIVATLFAAATALLVAIGARRLGARETGALGAAAIYLILLSLLGGRGGQAPVFYNLLVTGAALLTLRLPALAASRRRRAILVNGLAACLLAGLAIQMKYTPAIEGMFFGCVHLWYLRKAAVRIIPLTIAGLAWVLAGLLPTLGVIAGYALIGRAALGAFWFANFTSIGLRPGYPIDELTMRLLGIFAQLAPLILCTLLAWQHRPEAQPGRGRWLIAYGWLAHGPVLDYIDATLLPAALGIIVVSAIRLGRPIFHPSLDLVLAVITGVLAALPGVSPALVILGGGIAGAFLLRGEDEPD